jgi:hypothetical protein
MPGFAPLTAFKYPLGISGAEEDSFLSQEVAKKSTAMIASKYEEKAFIF